VLYGVPVMTLQLLFINDDSNITALLLISAYAIWALLVGWYVLHLWNREVVLYERGFTYREGSNEASFAYASVVEMYTRAERLSYFGLWTRDKYHLTLISDMDETMRITNLYSDIVPLADRLERFIARDRLPVVQGQLNAGERVSFGEHLHISQEALHINGETLPWEQFAGYRVRKGQVIFLQTSSTDRLQDTPATDETRAAKPARAQTGDTTEWKRIPAVAISQVLLVIGLLKRRVEPESAQPVSSSSSSSSADDSQNLSQRT
jgi:hypothetical protein